MWENGSKSKEDMALVSRCIEAPTRKAEEKDNGA